ncbi:hypothetical protein CC1G_02513 [Coprinopsis cinerea okayama7|uniref:RING-type domain-containing protein n=1 Tax=Coprinopsis cinerea (strain Okayama-7 / 130 / ATCC MYA-4618 / FGSC 9003) TaxID=240176 RepID=A8NBQ3_COPC7|nr:hypothetical protein CC1G_02513 [Coprinopsis cinerea okayama7\|eukprot:XP_001832251.2 hypothetical protein CC1G_02513 [Coprinopsis cinerea okayama7\
MSTFPSSQSQQQQQQMGTPQMQTHQTPGIAHLLPQNDINGNATVRDKKALEPLFGPNIGAVTSGPAWTASLDKKVVTDELTPEVVTSWVERSKDPTQPTTTLQALVNLKRPTIRLSPLSPIATNAVPSPATSAQHHYQQHALEFQYDADCPKVSIHIHVYLPKTHPDAPPGAPPHHPYAKLLIFESVCEGGFGRRLRLEDGAIFELGRFEKVPKITTASASGEGEEGNPEEKDGGAVSKEASGSSSNSETAQGVPTLTLNTNLGNDNNNAPNRPMKRLTQAFKFRRHTHNPNRTIAGPALAVVDAHAEEAQQNANGAPTNASSTAPSGQGKPAEEDGVKITIRLVALDEQGTELAAPNEQVTYLHVVRVGPRPTKERAPTSPTSPTAQSPTAEEGDKKEAVEEQEEEEEDTRPWVVKVVKREATIGPHTFHLHEIFGLTSSSSDTDVPAAQHSSPTHSYPPVYSHNDDPHHADDSMTAEECLLCLSSPREVVLLPCRHLVACKECALNMVEFGAGGVISSGGGDAANATTGGTANQTTTNAGGGNTGGGWLAEVAGAVGGSGGAAGNAENGAAPPPPPVTNPRRKRKAKGWFCPVCRQPYTSLLRLTTAPPPISASKETVLAGDLQRMSLGDPNANPASPNLATNDNNANNTNSDSTGNANASADNSTSGGGLLGNLTLPRPAFLRSLTGGSSANAGGNAGGGRITNDVESVGGLASGRVGA